MKRDDFQESGQMTTKNVVPKLCLAALSVPVICLVAILVTNNFLYSRALADWAFGPGIVTTSLILKVLPVIAVGTNVIIAVHRAALRKDYIWLGAAVVLWPLSFWYTLVEARPCTKGSSKSTPLRGSA